MELDWQLLKLVILFNDAFLSDSTALVAVKPGRVNSEVVTSQEPEAIE